MDKIDIASIPKFCISLKNSPRRKVVAKEFEAYGIHNVNFFDAVDKKDLIVPELSSKLENKSETALATGILACMMSHVKLITKAKELGLKAVWIMEDDVVFCDDFRERVKYIEDSNLKFDFLSLGGHFQKPDHKYIPLENCANSTKTPYIYKTKKQGGTYSYIITEKCYDFIIRNCTYQYGCDQFYSDHLYKNFNCYAFVPFLCGCAHGVSEITGTSWEYENINWFYQQEKMLKLIPETITKKIVEVKRIEPPTNPTTAIDLRDCTFITAVKIDSPDREFNFLRVIQYLCDNFATTIIIKESSHFSRIVEILPFIERKECIIKFEYEKNETGIFHRTRLLNEMLMMSTTDCTINYDIDCLMLPNDYVLARNKVINEGFDLVYPFAYGGEIQKQVTVPQHIKDNYKGENLFNPEWQLPWQSYCGHVQFFKTDSYISGGMENEEFVSYGPEDRERCERFQRLGYKVVWLDACIYHLEHSRDHNSSVSNTYFGINEGLMTMIRELSESELVEYYKNIPYIQKYLTHGK